MKPFSGFLLFTLKSKPFNMAVFLGLCSSIPASHMHCLQHLEKDTPCVATTPLHTQLCPLPGTPFSPSQYLFIQHHLAEILPIHKAFPASYSTAGHQPPPVPMHCDWQGLRYLLLQKLLSPRPYYKPLTGQYHTPLMSGLLEPGIKVQGCRFKTQHSVLWHKPVQYILLVLLFTIIIIIH